MDLPYSQQQQARRKNRSAGTLHQLSLAPMTTRLPVDDDFDRVDAGGHGHSQSHDQLYTYFSPTPTPSYLQGKSAPTTPRLLSKSPPASTLSRSHSHEGRHFLAGSGSGSGTRFASGTSRSNLRGVGGLPKSRSTTHLSHHGHAHGHSHRHHGGSRRHRTSGDDHRHGSALETDRASQNDWLFRTGALMTSETRETKGQSWLTARASSTSLTGLHDPVEEQSAVAFEQELARERGEVGIASGVGSHQVSRMGSRMGSRVVSRVGSRAVSRAHSRVGSRVQLLTPLDRRSLEMSGVGTGPGTATSSPSVGASGYFDAVDASGLAEAVDDWDGASSGGPDFVNLDAKLEAIEYEQDTSLADEDHVRRLVKREKAAGSWIGSVFGWSLFSVQETETDDDEDEDEDDEASETETDSDSEDGETTEGGEGRNTKGKGKGKRRRKSSQVLRMRQLEGAVNFEERLPPPPKANEGTWQDAAWLLSVATKVIL